jgi:hypothetical protein
MIDKQAKKQQHIEESKAQLEDAVATRQMLDKMRRKGFDYQERWHGFGSPVGLGLGFAFTGLGCYFLALAITTLW